MDNIPRVLIIGSGPSGLVLALALAKNGIQTRIIEKRQEPAPGQRGAGIMVDASPIVPRTLELFGQLGIVDQVLGEAVPVPRIRRYRLSDVTEVVQEIEMSPSTKPSSTTPFPNLLMLGQDRLEKILISALREHGGNVEYGIEMKTLTGSKECVNVKLIHHGPNNSIEEESQYDWVIGADGEKSEVRKRAGLTFDGESRADSLLVGDTSVEGLGPEYVCLSLRPTEKAGLFSFITGGNQVNLSEVGSLQPGNSPRMPCGKIAPLAGNFFSRYTMDVLVPVRDSLSLAWKLNLVVKGLASSELLESYTEERIPVVAEMLNLSTEYLDKALNQCPGEGGEWSRDGALHQLGINYRWSSIVLSDSGCKKTPPIDSYGRVATDVLQPGDRAPDSSGICLVETRATIPLVISRLSDVYKTTHHTVVIFTGVVDAKTVLMELSRYSGVLIQIVAVVPSEGYTSGSLPSTVDFVFTDTDGRVSQTYTEEESGLIIVRPDGMIGAMLRSSSSVHDYFSGIFLLSD
ncbi:monooxygenase [Coprinopsis cinerea okayama7|uniref:Monooxygenase n=1 Tax=Coprinopsis cinerea (strain Okayama-7 / 130 / ATCC MYA-4618 / FGSC 9003) TaxID=240176 RepID=A8N965_COPC7|nr:monooxygenase [Coprinopsis cinerea okayama7\|eukprot:XP_001831393.2 monooxygenase [Coprinopsis cinerea okayama7\